MNLLSRRVRGFRLLDLIGLGLLIVVIVGVYLAKTFAGTERAAIAGVERQIFAEKARIRLLQAEVAHLEKPGRIERLSVVNLGLEPLPAAREATVDQLQMLALAGPAPKSTAPSVVAAMVEDHSVVPGVPPPDPSGDHPVALAEAQR